MMMKNDEYNNNHQKVGGGVLPKNNNNQKYNARIYESFPIRYWDRWLNNDIQPHLFVQQAKVGAVARSLLVNTKLVSLPGFGGLDAENGETLPYVWTLDNKSLVFIARTNKNMAVRASTPGQLFCVDLIVGSEPILLTNGTASYDDPVFRPDGKALLTKCEMGGDGKTYHHDGIMSFPWPFSMEKRIDLTAELDLSVVNFVVDSESKTIYFIAESGEQTSLFSVSSSGGAVKAHNMPKHGCLTGLALGGSEFVACYESASCPVEVVRLNVISDSYHAITHFNTAKTSQLDLPPIDRFTFTSAKGRMIHNLLVRPAGFDLRRKYPLLVMIHGGPTPQFKDCWMVRQNYRLLASDCFVLLLTNYSGSCGYSEEFGQAIQFDPIITPADEVNQAADEASKRYTFINGSLRGVLGASYGGHLANWMEATTTHYKAIISHAGLSSQANQWATSDIIYSREMNMGGPVWENNVIWNDHSPTLHAGNHALGTGWVTPILLTVGEHDFRVPINNTLEMFTYLQRLQVPSKLIVFPDANHHIMKGEDSRFWYNEVHSWLVKHLTNDKQLSML
jgi:dipeptidyl aminopeptidase/acylaminoacyl peptidase